MAGSGGPIARFIAAFKRGYAESAAKQRAAAPPAPRLPGAKAAPARPPAVDAVIATAKAPAPRAPSPATGIVDPRRRPSPPTSTIAPITAPPVFELPGLELLETAADPARRVRPSAHDARLGVLAALKAPGTLASGVVISEILAPPLSLRPPRTGP